MQNEIVKSVAGSGRGTCDYYIFGSAEMGRDELCMGYVCGGGGMGRTRQMGFSPLPPGPTQNMGKNSERGGGQPVIYMLSVGRSWAHMVPYFSVLKLKIVGE